MDRNDLQDNRLVELHQNWIKYNSHLPLSYAVKIITEYSFLF